MTVEEAIKGLINAQKSFKAATPSFADYCKKMDRKDHEHG